MKNRHPVDELADVRAQIKALQEHEGVLKDQVLARLADRPAPGETQSVLGDEFIAQIQLIESERLDRKAVEAVLSGPKFAKCLRKSQSLTVRVTPRMRAAA